MAECACGRPLHYSDPRTRLAVERLIGEFGADIPVQTPRGAYLVPRHYIALHGLAAKELPRLARRYGWQPLPVRTAAP